MRAHLVSSRLQQSADGSASDFEAVLHIHQRGDGVLPCLLERPCASEVTMHAI